MNVTAMSLFGRAKFSPQRWLGAAAVALGIALLFFRVPQSPGDGDQSYRMLLDLSYRPSAIASPAGTLDGPLVPLQNSVYVGRSIWRSVVWQVGGNLLMAGLLTATVFRLPKARAWWAMVLFVVLGMADTSIAPWISIFVLSLGIRGFRTALPVILAGTGLGLFALTSIAHFILAASAAALPLARRNESPVLRAGAILGFVGGVSATWLLLELSPARFGAWLWFGLTGAWTPSSLVIAPAVPSVFPLAAAALAGWLGLLFWRTKSDARPCAHRADLLLVAVGLVLSWKLVALQPSGTTLLFFVTVLFGGFVLLPSAPRFASLLFVLGAVGSAIPDPIVLTDAAGRINRRLLQNLSEISQTKNLRQRLRAGFSGYAAGFPMPRTRGALELGSAAVIGDRAMPGLLNEFRILPSASFGTAFVRDDAGSAKNAAALLAPDSAPFVLHSSDRDGDLLPGLRDGPARLALLQGYELQFYEQGLSLWKKRSGAARDEPVMVGSGTVRFGEELKLPAGEDAYWIELDCSPNWAGLIVDQAKPLAEPAIHVVDANGVGLRYRIAWRMARAGFLLRPFFHGDLDGLRFMEGEPLPAVERVSFQLPESTAWAWSKDIRYRLYRVPLHAQKNVPGLSQPIREQFAALNRLPASVDAPFVPMFGKVAEKPAVFMHPDSVFELTATATDRVVTGTFGISPGAYTNGGPNVTDGVLFSVELVPATGPKTVLFQRYLDPAEVLDDRGPQSLTIALPAVSGGRLLFRTVNLPGKTSAFDWSYWREIELK